MSQGRAARAGKQHHTRGLHIALSAAPTQGSSRSNRTGPSGAAWSETRSASHCLLGQSCAAAGSPSSAATPDDEARRAHPKSQHVVPKANSAAVGGRCFPRIRRYSPWDETAGRMITFWERKLIADGFPLTDWRLGQPLSSRQPQSCCPGRISSIFASHYDSTAAFAGTTTTPGCPAPSRSWRDVTQFTPSGIVKQETCSPCCYATLIGPGHFATALQTRRLVCMRRHGWVLVWDAPLSLSLSP